MTSTQIRQSFLDFFKSKQHTIVPSSSLMPDSPNLLFTNAGMNQFVPIFLGQTKCPYTPGRAADTQKCIRAGGKHNDLDDVGLDTYHHTFFEMLGNWSFGDYFKREAIDWAWELVVRKWGFPANRLYATVFCPHMDIAQWNEELKGAVWFAQTRMKGGTAEYGQEVVGGPKGGLAINESDEEAASFWAEHFLRAGIDPLTHIVPGNRKDNFWMMGETGPCGPCSELHVDLTPAGDTKGSLVNKGDARCIEIWNLVFIQFNANPNGSFSPLPAKHVDTGMGFERVTSIIQGTKNFSDFANAKISNYETDIFRPIFDELEKLSGKKYGSTLPGDAIAKVEADEPLKTSGEARGNIIEVEAEEHGVHSSSPCDDEDDFPVVTTSAEQIALDIAFRVIADHIRTLSFAIADRIQPGNNDRNYVLRRILRRAVRYGRTLGFHEPFFYKLVDVLADMMGDVFPEIRARKKQVQETIRTEEEAFNKTLDRGIDLFESEVFGNAVMQAARRDGYTKSAYTEQTFDLIRDGHPTISLSMEQLKRGAWNQFLKSAPTILGDDAFKLYDTYGFPLDLTELMARERGLTVDKDGFEKLMEEQRARARAAQKKEVISLSQIETTTPTKFVGFEKLESPARVLEVVSVKDKTAVVLDTSPFYAEMGGQVGDTGELTGSGQLWRVTNTQKSGNTFLHFVEGGDAPAVGAGVTLSVEKVRRDAIQRHHTVTHLLHWALHEVASKEASQKGSFVGPDKLTFDFNSAPLTPAQVADIEKLVNERILENAGVAWTEVPHADVKHRKDVMQFFGDKYGDTVRVVQIGGGAGKLDGYSMELCGGTHTRATGEIGLFRIVGESAIAAGVRRIEAVAGLTAYDLANQQLQLIRSIAGKINSPVGELEKKVEALLAHQKELEKSLRTANQREAAGRAKELLAKAETVLGVPAIIANLGDADGDTLQTVADSLKSQFKGVIVLGGASNGAVSLVAAVTSDFTAKVQAGKIIQTIAPIVGGKGGGKPDNARGGGKDASRLDEALAKVKILLG
ncbi:MAG TPA: alanine--tRNA ligase [Candidatus Limnocylindrales bacterium]|nr:alanine--tRNA ligase [Candidatus Limnocylindrales bacterium]